MIAAQEERTLESLGRPGSASAEILEVCSVRVGDTLFGIPIAQILEILGRPAAQSVPLAPSWVGGLVHYRGELLTAVSLRRLLGMEPLGAPEDVLVFESTGGHYGLLVDAVSEVLTVSASEYEPPPATLDSRRKTLYAGTWKRKEGLLIALEAARFEPTHLSRTLEA
ncbi:chemotaxis protein CheW [Paracidobacterium acidisoli]|nr:chemotaxis protein CheW [Paracidobacterium acidisoli]MBT9331354.1 chemotaxis protein CheW [Paracidobacterium acidisoli]